MDSPQELELTGCPQCAAPAEIVDRFELPSTDGPIVHVKIQCVHRHWFLGPAAEEGSGWTPRAA